MVNGQDEESFTFSWLALKLLGRGLYSNPWSALSELVANGLDAGAKNVYVYVDAREKSNATVEVVDDGSGMSREDISTYVQVGHNKRKHAQQHGIMDTGDIKGRKGIGKLAALFLSQHFFLQTRHPDGETSWELDAREGRVQDEENPRLLSAENVPQTSNGTIWDGFTTGTRLILCGVDLSGYGPRSINALGSRLANQFLLPSNQPPQILLWVRDENSKSSPQYAPVEKSVAFKNLAEIMQSFPKGSFQPSELANPLRPVIIPVKGLPGNVYEHVPVSTPFPDEQPDDEAWQEIAADVDRSNRTYRGIKYSLTGWIGAHATIASNAAQENDERFIKNRYYNPAQIRVYVRGKLANEHLLSQLGLTGTYTNYIEGELTFDLLDEDTLPDIATSNRQDFDETDNRVTLLRALVRPMVQSLIQRRTMLASKINNEVTKEKRRRDTASKRHFSDQLRNDLSQHPEISAPVRDELQMVITNKIRGSVEPKQDYRIFISHARADKPFVAFIDEILRSRGAREEEIFFTSRTGTVSTALDERALGEIIRESITDANTLIFYLTSRNFLKSQFCLFEGGAGWATRSVSEYLKLNVDYDSIPKFLTNGRSEVTLLGPENTIELSPEIHNYLITGVLNPMIAHLNRGRDISGLPAIEPFELEEVPSAVELSRLQKSPADYYHEVVKEHWQVIVQRDLAHYLSEY